MQRLAFEAVILLHEVDEDGNVDTDLLYAGTIVAASLEAAKMVAFNELDPEYRERVDELEVLVRPF